MVELVMDEQTIDDVVYRAGFGKGGPDSPFRYTLSRYWRGAPAQPQDKRASQYALFIMLNPSTADARENDRTVSRCMGFARRWGYGGLEVRNLFAHRATKPVDLRRVQGPVGGALNDRVIIDAINHKDCGVVVAAWGNHGKLNGRSQAVRAILKQTKRPICAFCMSACAEPMHPLYQRAELAPDNGMVRYL
jgi:hypothetical protein